MSTLTFGGRRIEDKPVQSLPLIKTQRTLCRLAQNQDIPAILDFYRQNEAHLKPWEPERPPGFLTLQYWSNRIPSLQQEALEDRSLRLWIFDLQNPQTVIGNISASAIERGPFQNCRLGYALAKGYEGKGILSESLEAVIQYLFKSRGFHRVEANFVESNIRSRAVLQRLGFEFHGVAKNYLKINGRWQDHVLGSRINTHYEK